MKKNLFFATILCIGLLAIINSCVKDTFTEQDAYDQQRKTAMQQDSLAKSKLEFETKLANDQALLLDSLEKVGGKINYSVGVVVASESSWLSLWETTKGDKGLDAAIVTIAQHGVIMTATTGGSGIASFKDLRIGNANVNIRKTGYTTVDFVVDLTVPRNSSDTDTTGMDLGDDDIKGFPHVVTMVPIFSLTDNLSTISGIVTVESDLTNDTQEPAANIKVKAIIDADHQDFKDYLKQPEVVAKGDEPDWVEYYGVIKQIAYGSTVSTATTGADGSYSMNVPSSPKGLPIKVSIDEFALNQQLLQGSINLTPVWGVQSIRTLFGSAMTYSEVPTKGLNWGEFQSAYVTFSAPTGTAAPQPTTDASATAILTSSGIVSVNITSPGEGYTQAPWVKFSLGTAYNSIQAEGTAVINGGRVTDVTITSPGSGYKPGDTPIITFVEGLSEVASAKPKMGYSLGEIPVTSAGSGYTAAPTVIITSSTGTGAAATAVTTGYVSKLNVTNTGTGYTATPIVTIAPSTGITAVASTVNMTDRNPIHSVTVPTSFIQWTRRKLGTRITGNGSGARTDSTTLGTAGRIESINIVSGGSGYVIAPTVAITGGGGTGAVATATLTADVVTGITIVNQGQNYTSAPTITLTPAPTGGTNATANSTIEFRITGVNILDNGNGYSTATVEFETAPQSGSFVTPVGPVANFSMGVASIAMSAVNGTEYTAAPAVTITPSNGVVGTPATATSEIAYGVKNILVTTQGSGFEYGDITVSLTAPPAGGTPATLGTPDMINGVLKRVDFGLPGVGYTAAPHVYLTVTGGGVIPVKQAELSATVSGGQITGITIVDPGLGYDWATEGTNKYSIVITTFKSGATASANPNPESGKIEFIQVDATGSGYAVAPDVIIYNSSQGDANGFGTGAAATAVVTDGRISAITITNAGSGYYATPTIQITVPSTVITATGRCVINNGRIMDVTLVGPNYPNYFFGGGYGYEAPPTLTFFPAVAGQGSGAEGVAVVSNGSVTDVIMTNQGSGYVGMNKPLKRDVQITPSWDVKTIGGRSYLRDIYMGTGQRTMVQ